MQSSYVTFLEALNPDAQLVAIGGLLARQERADQELSDEIRKADEVARRTRGLANEHAVAAWVDLAEMSCYQDAAHSMAAVGMIAPFVESLFRAYFRCTGKELPHRDTVRNVLKRVEEDGMKEYMPTDLERTLSALFAYRNSMFHRGFEWPSEELKSFERKVKEGLWPEDWFSWATWRQGTSDPEPWMCYMTPVFISHCLDVADGVIRGIEKYETRDLPNLPPSDLTNAIWKFAP